MSLKPTPPGYTLLELLRAKGLSQTQLASKMKRPIKTINEIIHAKTRLTEDTAIQLEAVLRVPAEFWMNMETSYRLYMARRAR